MNGARASYLSLFSVLFFSLGTVAGAQQAAPSAQDQHIMREMAGAPDHSGKSTNGASEQTALEHKEKLQKKVTTQSAQLLALAQKLNADVAKSNANQLSVSVVKEATEIEKLAKSIKKKAHNERKRE